MAEELASNALTTLERVKSEFNIDESDTNYDDNLTRFINEASDFVETYIGRNLGFTSGKKEVLEGTGDNYLYLRNRPIVAVNSVKFKFPDGYEREIEDYELTDDDMRVGCLYRDNTWIKLTYTAGLARDNFGGRRLIEVDYDYGYVLPKDETSEKPRTLPRSIEAIVIQLVGAKFQETQRESYGLESLKQGRLTYRFKDDMLSTNDISILKKFKNFGAW